MEADNGRAMRQKVPIKLKDKVYKTVIRPTMTLWSRVLGVRKKRENRLHVAEMRMVRTYQEKRRRKPMKTNDGHGRTGEEKTGRPRRRWIDNNREDMNKYELTADMNENRQYWKIMAKTGPQRCGDGL